VGPKSSKGPGPPGRVRVTGGLHKGRLLAVPPQARPTEGRVREALFSIWREPLADGARVLDLFAGSGVVGLEAAGRGALRVVCVEGDRRSFPVLQSNRDRLGESLVELRTLELPAGLATIAEGEGERFDLVFADPPYRFSGYAELLASIAPLLADGGEVAVEHSARTPMPAEVPADPEPLIRTDQRRYGESALSFYRVSG
jgi:16S rRNA (guanine966-N2)-methyltransferase